MVEEIETESGVARIDMSEPDRDELLLGESIDWENDDPHGVKKMTDADWSDYDPIKPETARKAIELGYLDAESEKDPVAPNAKRLIEYTRNLDGDTIDAYLIGFVISPLRGDSTVVIEGFILKGDTRGLDIPFEADEMENDGSYVRYWWD